MSSAANRVERRRHPREVIAGVYELLLDRSDGHKPMKCFIWDISEGGARLRLTENSDSMPDKMLARIGNVSKPLRLVWRKQDEIGIEFLETEEIATVDPLL